MRQPIYLGKISEEKSCHRIFDTLDNVKRTKSPRREMCYRVVHIKQCYCLSYRMWKGFIGCVALIRLQDFVWKEFLVLSVSLYTVIPPFRRPLKLQYDPQPPHGWALTGFMLVFVGHNLSRWSIMPWATSCTHACTSAPPRSTQNYLCSEKG